MRTNIESPTDSVSFATPRLNVRQEDCYFYHVCQLPDVGLVGGHWDLRSGIDDYLGNFNFKGKSVLDVGAASGFLTFEMEKRGATVVSFDVASAKLMQIDPHCKTPDRREELMASQERDLDRLKNAYWFCHRHFGSSARVYYGDVHNLPPNFGPFEVVMLGTCLPTCGIRSVPWNP